MLTEDGKPLQLPPRLEHLVAQLETLTGAGFEVTTQTFYTPLGATMTCVLLPGWMSGQPGTPHKLVRHERYGKDIVDCVATACARLLRYWRGGGAMLGFRAHHERAMQEVLDSVPRGSGLVMFSGASVDKTPGVGLHNVSVAEQLRHLRPLVDGLLTTLPYYPEIMRARAWLHQHFPELDGHQAIWWRRIHNQFTAPFEVAGHEMFPQAITDKMMVLEGLRAWAFREWRTRLALWAAADAPTIPDVWANVYSSNTWAEAFVDDFQGVPDAGGEESVRLIDTLADRLRVKSWFSWGAVGGEAPPWPIAGVPLPPPEESTEPPADDGTTAPILKLWDPYEGAWFSGPTAAT